MRQSFCPPDRLTMARPSTQQKSTPTYTRIHSRGSQTHRASCAERALNKQIKGRLTVAGSIQWSRPTDKGDFGSLLLRYLPHEPPRGGIRLSLRSRMQSSDNNSILQNLARYSLWGQNQLNVDVVISSESRGHLWQLLI